MRMDANVRQRKGTIPPHTKHIAVIGECLTSLKYCRDTLIEELKFETSAYTHLHLTIFSASSSSTQRITEGYLRAAKRLLSKLRRTHPDITIHFQPRRTVTRITRLALRPGLPSSNGRRYMLHHARLDRAEKKGEACEDEQEMEMEDVVYCREEMVQATQPELSLEASAADQLSEVELGGVTFFIPLLQH